MAKRKAKKSIAKGVVYVAATFNNTVITVTDEMGNVIAWSSAGSLGFRAVSYTHLTLPTNREV